MAMTKYVFFVIYGKYLLFEGYVKMSIYYVLSLLNIEERLLQKIKK